MTYFADLTPYVYTPGNHPGVVNVGWLDAAHPFKRGETPGAFREALERLVGQPMLKHRGYHHCPFCPAAPGFPPHRGSGQVRVRGKDGVWYAAPAMVHHYVAVHGYRPPAPFIDAVLHPLGIGRDA